MFVATKKINKKPRIMKLKFENEFCLCDEHYTKTEIKEIRYIPKNTKIYNMKSNWNKRIKPHLGSEEVIEAMEFNFYELMNQEYVDDVDWSNVLYFLFGNVGSEDESRIKPQSYRAFRASGQCFRLGDFNRVIGEKLFPQLKWFKLESEFHANAVGFNELGQLEVIMDILWGEYFDTPRHLLIQMDTEQRIYSDQVESDIDSEVDYYE